MTHTPASGPFALVTTPPISSLSIATVAPFLCCAWTQGNEAATARAHATANKPNLRFTRNFICSSAADVQVTSLLRMFGILQLRRAYTQSLPFAHCFPLRIPLLCEGINITSLTEDRCEGEILKSDDSCISNPKSEISDLRWAFVRFQNLSLSRSRKYVVALCED